MLYIILGSRKSCCILSQNYLQMLYIVPGARSKWCTLSQEVGVGAVYCFRS